MDHIPDYIARKDGVVPIEYLHPKLETILNDTYGTLVYQDQVLQIVQAIAGYSLGHADILRKAMGKKIPEEMQKEKQNFLDGARENGVESSVADAIWEQIEPFSGYGFNRAHAYCYGNIAYQTAYLKANYPVEYMTAMLTIESGDTKKVALAVGECKRIGVTILRPDINESDIEFCAVDGNTIRYGIGAIIGVGTIAAKQIIYERSKNGPYASIDDFYERNNLKVVNKGIIERLIKSGAMDDFGRREQLLETIETSLKSGKKMQDKLESGQMSMFELLPPDQRVLSSLPDIPEAQSDQLSVWEKEAFGFYLTNHPYQIASEDLIDTVTTSLAQLNEVEPGSKIIVAGAITDVRFITTKRGDQMAVAMLEDLYGAAEIVVFPRQFKIYKDKLKEDSIVVVVGNAKPKNFGADESAIDVIAESVRVWEKIVEPKEEPKVHSGIPAGKTLMDMIRGNK